MCCEEGEAEDAGGGETRGKGQKREETGTTISAHKFHAFISPSKKKRFLILKTCSLVSAYEK